jgi:hypothetical protein
MKNFIPWASGGGEILDVSGDVHTDRLVTATFAPGKTDEP